MSSPLTYADICHGFGGAAIAARAAGYRLLWGIERDPALAAVARQNLGDHIITADVLAVDPGTLAAPDLLHASPPCPNFSNANARGTETEGDIALARKVAEFVDVLRPRVFTLENVYLYRQSESWAIIRNTLYECGYWLDLAHVNAADYGVPQTRKRMFARAVHQAWVPGLPPAESWRGWYQAIEDLLPTLPESQLAPWQLRRLPESIRETVLFSQGISRDHQGQEYGCTFRKAGEPAFTVTANHNQNQVRAFLVDSQNAGHGTITVRADNEPAFTCTANMVDHHREPRALLIGGYFGNPLGRERSPQVRAADEPAFTVTAGWHGDTRGWLAGGRVVLMTPRALARFQTFPDGYELPEQNTLACRGIGNAVPPLLYQKIISCFQEVRYQP